MGKKEGALDCSLSSVAVFKVGPGLFECGKRRLLVAFENTEMILFFNTVYYSVRLFLPHKALNQGVLAVSPRIHRG